MKTSDSLTELAAALAKAQAAMRNAVKDAENPHFRSKYADLASVREACFPALTANGLSVVQSPRLVAAQFGDQHEWIVEVETLLLHTSGQFLSDVASTPIAKADAQGVGSAVTYLRRYALAAFAGIAPEDDDANAASKPAAVHTSAAPVSRPKPVSVAENLGGLTVTDVTQKPVAGGRIQWTVLFSDGTSGTTINERVSLAAINARDDGSPVRPTLETKGRFVNLTALAVLDAPDLPLDDDVPQYMNDEPPY